MEGLSEVASALGGGLIFKIIARVENGTTKLTIDRLEEIAKILDVPVENILSSEKRVFNLENNAIEKFYGYIENLQEENKELIQTQIDLLKQQNEQLIKAIEALTKKL